MNNRIVSRIETSLLREQLNVISRKESADVAALRNKISQGLKENIVLDGTRFSATILWSDSLSESERNFLDKYYLIGEDYSNGNYIIEDKKTGVIYSLDLHNGPEINSSSIHRIASSSKEFKRHINEEALLMPRKESRALKSKEKTINRLKSSINDKGRVNYSLEWLVAASLHHSGVLKQLNNKLGLTTNKSGGSLFGGLLGGVAYGIKEMDILTKLIMTDEFEKDIMNWFREVLVGGSSSLRSLLNQFESERDLANKTLDSGEIADLSAVKKAWGSLYRGAHREGRRQVGLLKKEIADRDRAMKIEAKENAIRKKEARKEARRYRRENM